MQISQHELTKYHNEFYWQTKLKYPRKTTDTDTLYYYNTRIYLYQVHLLVINQNQEFSVNMALFKWVDVHQLPYYHNNSFFLHSNASTCQGRIGIIFISSTLPLFYACHKPWASLPSVSAVVFSVFRCLRLWYNIPPQQSIIISNIYCLTFFIFNMCR